MLDFLKTLLYYNGHSYHLTLANDEKKATMECRMPVVFIVDDNREICDLTREELAEKDYVYEVASNADDALVEKNRIREV
jgi:PleD family two-component response regulator